MSFLDSLTAGILCILVDNHVKVLLIALIFAAAAVLYGERADLPGLPASGTPIFEREVVMRVLDSDAGARSTAGSLS